MSYFQSNMSYDSPKKVEVLFGLSLVTTCFYGVHVSTLVLERTTQNNEL